MQVAATFPPPEDPEDLDSFETMGLSLDAEAVTQVTPYEAQLDVENLLRFAHSFGVKLNERKKAQRVVKGSSAASSTGGSRKQAATVAACSAASSVSQVCSLPPLPWSQLSNPHSTTTSHLPWSHRL